MFLNNFSVRIPEGTETPGGYVQMRHGKRYTLVIRNNRLVRCDARIEIDGKHVGTWRIPPLQNITLERPAHDDGHFTFYRSGSGEALKAGEGDVYVADRGLIRVTFTPEKVVEKKISYTMSGEWPSSSRIRDSGMVSKGITTTSSTKEMSAGITGLSGHSSQTFGTAVPITHDLREQTVIHLRLVCDNSGPRPLTAYSTPVPPAV